MFIDHLDHSLLSSEVRNWIKPDVILQIGSQTRSKRISQMLEDCFPCSYILVDNHPNRHDPSHIITHRIYSSIIHFADWVLRSCIKTCINSEWTSFMCSINRMVDWEVSFLIKSENSLTEPYVAHITSEALNYGSPIFVGNSMPIRDAHMYGNSLGESTSGNDSQLTSGFPFWWVQVVGTGSQWDRWFT